MKVERKDNDKDVDETKRQIAEIEDAVSMSMSVCALADGAGPRWRRICGRMRAR